MALPTAEVSATAQQSVASAEPGLALVCTSADPMYCLPSIWRPHATPNGRRTVVARSPGFQSLS
jgi:hypothetical protein